jgi:hypothetical protein
MICSKKIKKGNEKIDGNENIFRGECTGLESIDHLTDSM